MQLTREQALDLLKQYNKEPFHIRHALTVEAVMGWFARELGYGDEAEFWSIWTLRCGRMSTASSPRPSCGRPVWRSP